MLQSGASAHLAKQRPSQAPTWGFGGQTIVHLAKQRLSQAPTRGFGRQKNSSPRRIEAFLGSNQALWRADNSSPYRTEAFPSSNHGLWRADNSSPCRTEAFRWDSPFAQLLVVAPRTQEIHKTMATELNCFPSPGLFRVHHPTPLNEHRPNLTQTTTLVTFGHKTPPIKPTQFLALTKHNLNIILTHELN